MAANEVFAVVPLEGPPQERDVANCTHVKHCETMYSRHRHVDKLSDGFTNT